MNYLVPLVVLVALVGWLVVQRRRLAQAHELHAGFVLSTLAPKLGLSIVSGAPDANIMLPPHNTGRSRVSDDKPYEWNVRLQGMPRGRPVELVYFDRREQQTKESLLSTRVKLTHFWDAYIAVQLRGGVPDFEVISNQSSLGPLQRRHPFPVQRSGDPIIDGTFTIASSDPGVAAKLGPLLPRFDPNLLAYGIHLESRDGWLFFRADKQHVSGNFYFVEHIIPMLEQIADRLEQPS